MSSWSRTTCAECGEVLRVLKGPGRPPTYCDADCRNAARRQRAREAHRALLEELHRYRSAAAQAVRP